jgi:hypothetical protein
LKIKTLEEELETQREMNKKILKQMRQMEYALIEQKKLRAQDKKGENKGSKTLTNGGGSSVPSGGQKTTSNSLKQNNTSHGSGATLNNFSNGQNPPLITNASISSN